MPPELTPSVIANRYQLEAQLGHGGMGVVYCAFDRLTGQQVALKRVTTPTERLQFGERLTADDDTSDLTNLRMALAQEFSTLASLRHPHIIRVLDYGFDKNQQPFLTMDLLPRPRTLIEAGRDQPLEAKIDLLVQTLQALAYLHRRGIVHRDLKPDNVAVIEENGAPHVRVLDFGLAVQPHPTARQTNQLAGTLAYIAPEVLQGDLASRASDLYAVGVMAFELLVGHHPFDADTPTEMISKVLKSDPDLMPLMALTPAVPLDEIVLTPDSESISASLPLIIDRLLVKHPSERYADAYDVIRDLCSAVKLPIPEESRAIRESFLQAAQFVGRQEELARLRGALLAAQSGMGCTWLIGGESGVGKSRLLGELATRALTAGITVLRGQAAASGGLPYQVWREPLRRLILSTPVTPEEASVLALVLPEFIDAPPFDGIDAPHHVIRLIVDLFQRQSEPLVLLLEDLQWADDSLEAIKRLSLFAAQFPLLIVATYRDDERPTLEAEFPQAQQMRLQRLTPDEIANLAVSMLGRVGQGDDLLSFLQHETEGNAFFLVETVRALAEEAGSLSEIGRSTLPEHVITGGMQRVIERRLNRVPVELRDLLKLAAVMGREVDSQLLRRALLDEPPIDLDEALTICANLAVLEVQEGGWRFAHDKLREALLAALTPDERAAFNRTAAEAIEDVYADDLTAYASALTGHWHDAGDTRKEGYYAPIAAKQAQDNSLYQEAQQLYKRALELGASDATGPPAPSEAQLHHELGNVLYRLNEFSNARAQQQAALAIYRQIGDRAGIANAINALGESDMRQGSFDQARAYFEEALAIRRALNLTRDIGYSHMNLGVIEYELNHLQQARDLFAQCLEYMRTAGSPRDLARALNNYGNILDMTGESENARAIHYEALAIRERERDLHGVCYSLINLGISASDQAHYDEAQPLLERALRLTRQIGDRLAEAASLGGLGDIHIKQGEYEQAQRFYTEALEIRRQVEDRSGTVFVLRTLGDIARLRGDHLTSLARYQEALALSSAGHFTMHTLDILHSTAALLKQQNRRRSALKLLAFVRSQRESPTPEDDDLLLELENALPPNAAASAVALGEALTLDDVIAKFDDGSLDF